MVGRPLLLRDGIVGRPLFPSLLQGVRIDSNALCKGSLWNPFQFTMDPQQFQCALKGIHMESNAVWKGSIICIPMSPVSCTTWDPIMDPKKFCKQSLWNGHSWQEYACLCSPCTPWQDKSKLQKLSLNRPGSQKKESKVRRLEGVIYISPFPAPINEAGFCCIT